MLLPTRITRYLLAELLGPTLLGLLLYSFVLLMNHFFYVAEKALAKNLGADLTIRLFLTGLPDVLVLCIPMSVLLGTLIGVGRFSADHEWVALQSAGQGPWRLLKPILIHGLLASLVGFYVFAEVAPRAHYAQRNLAGEVLFASSLAADLKPRVFYTDLPDHVLFVEDIRAGDSPVPGYQGRLRGVLLVQKDADSGRTELVLARSGNLYPADDRSGDLVLELFRGVGQSFDADAELKELAQPAHEHEERADLVISRFETTQRVIPAQEYVKDWLTPRNPGVTDLGFLGLLAERREAWSLAEEARQAAAGKALRDPSRSTDLFVAENRLRVATIEMNSRIALPMASLFFAVLAMPLGIRRARSGKGAGFALSLLVILVYWATFTFCRDRAVAGDLPAMVGPWVANAVIVVWAAYAFWRLGRPPREGLGLFARVARILLRGAATLRRLVTEHRLRRRDPESPAESENQDPLENLSGTSRRFVARLDRYVGVSYLRLLMLALMSGYLIYGLVELKKLMDGLLRTNQSAALLIQYFQFFAPSVLHLILPLACLVGAVVTFTLLSRTGELTAIKASGISVIRATFPVLVLTLLLCALLFVIQDRVSPLTQRRAQSISDQIMGRAPKTYGTNAGGHWSFGPDGRRLYYYRLYDPDKHEFYGLRVFELDRETPRILSHRFHPRARPGEDGWTVDGGWYRTFPANGVPVTYQAIEGTQKVHLDMPADFNAREVQFVAGGDLPEQLSLQEIRDQIASLRASGYDTTQLEVAFHGKLAQALSPLVMVLLGLPFSFKVGRRGSLYGIGVALILILVYWAVFALFNALGLETLLDPWAAAWAPNILFGLIGSYLMLYVKT